MNFKNISSIQENISSIQENISSIQENISSIQKYQGLSLLPVTFAGSPS